MSSEDEPRHWSHDCAESEGTAVEVLARVSGLSKSRVKRLMVQGAAWLRRGGRGERRRLRRASTSMQPGDRLELFYDPRLVAIEPPQAECVADRGRYSVWYKPAGLMAQGNDYGDHAALTRQVEQAFPSRPVLTVHRLDRETAGLMLLAHDRKTAAALSALFREGGIEKRYRAQVLGRLEGEGKIDDLLDGKPALTRYRSLGWDPDKGVSVLDVWIDTGRTHQIRRHLEAIDHPVMGDPRYGRGNKNREGLRLVAVSLAFDCPVERARVVFELDGRHLEFPAAC